MDKIDGVILNVFFGGRALEVEEDGYVGRLERGQAAIDVRVLPGASILGFTVNGKKDVTPKADLAPTADPPEEGHYYRLSVPIKTNAEGIHYTDYLQNNLRLLRLDGDGKVRMWEIALISQGGDFFLTAQPTYTAQCYQDGDAIVCPRFARWPQMLDFLGSLLEGVGKVSHSAEYRDDEEEPSADGLEACTGRVIWFNLAQGLGAIITPSGAARVHWSGIAKRPRLAYLAKGELVSFKELQEPRQTKPRLTAFDYEAVGVSPIKE